jgi:GNAT superfamily N-acetyltransferase
MEITVRKATPQDISAIFTLINELALYEKAPHEVTNSEEKMLQDGFGEHPIFQSSVAEYEGKIVGMYVWYIRYSTWKGKGLYLEDIIVTESMRGQKVGDALFKACLHDAKEMGANFMTWQVLDWNEPAINFYKKYNSSFDGGWINVKLLPESFV